MSDQRALPVGDRDETIEPRRGELPSKFIERAAAEMAPPPTKPAATCGCRARGWQCRHEPSFEERLALIFRGGRQPGEDDA